MTNQIAYSLGRILLGICSLGSLLKTVDFAEKNLSYPNSGYSEGNRIGRLRREGYQRNTYSEHGRDRRDRRTNAERIHILRVVELADFRKEKPLKNENSRVKELEGCYSAQQIEIITMQCTLFMQKPKRKEFTIPHCIFECFVNFFIHETRLFAISRRSTSFMSDGF